MVSNITPPKPHTVFTIDKRSNLSQTDLIKEYVEPSIPVVLTDAARNWKGMGKLTPQYFKENYGEVTKEIAGVKYKLADVLDMILEENADRKAPYPFNFNVKHYFPELLSELTPEILYRRYWFMGKLQVVLSTGRKEEFNFT